MNPDFRALCAELLDALNGWHQAVFETGTGWVRPDETYLLDRARAALAEPDGPAVPEGREPAAVVSEPSDEDIDAWITECADATRYGPLQHYWAFDVGFDDARDIARAVLARFGHHSPDATKMVGHAEGEGVDEVRYVVKELRDQADGLSPSIELFGLIHRAADLLEQFSSGWVVPTVEQFAPVPVPVSERLPGDELCWWFEADEDCGYGSNWTLLRIRGCASGYTHWLPATALPLPTDAGQSPA